MRVLLAALFAAPLLGAATADARFDVRDAFVVAPEPRSPEVAVNARGASLTAYVEAGVLRVRERSASGVVTGPTDLQVPGASSAEVTLDDAGGALVVAETADGPVALTRSAGGTFGPPEPLAGPLIRIEALAGDGAGNVAVVLSEPLPDDASRLSLRLRPAGGGFGPATALSRGSASADLAFGEGGRVAVTVVDQAAFSFEPGRRVAVRTGRVAEGVGRAVVLARARAGERFDAARPALDGGLVRVVMDVSRETVRSTLLSVRLAALAADGRVVAPRTLSGGGAYDAQITSVGGRTAVAWASVSPTRPGIHVARCTGATTCARAQRVSPPERGFSPSTGRSKAVAGATEARSSGPRLRFSRAGDLGVVWASSPFFGPSTLLGAVRRREARGFDGPAPVSPLGSDAIAGEPAWTRAGMLLVPFRSGATVALAVRAGAAVAARPTDRSAPRVTLGTPTAAGLRAGVLAARVRCSEACAVVPRGLVVVGNDINKPASDTPILIPASRSVVVSLPLVRKEREELAAGERTFRARLRLSVVDRLGNARTAETQICSPRRC